MTRPDWDTYFLGMAHAASARANCSRRRVGAVIVNSDHHVIGAGYNGAPSGMDGCLEGACPRGAANSVAPASDYDTVGRGFCPAVHAEVNAVLHAIQSVRGAVCYVTHEPCVGCTRTLAGAGILEVIWPGGRVIPMSRLETLVSDSVNGL